MVQKIKCPHFKTPCLEHGCTHYIQLLGSDPQTGEDKNQFICADLAQITIALEANKEIRQLAAAVESFRNNVEGQKVILDLSKIIEVTQRTNSFVPVIPSLRAEAEISKP